MAVPVTVTTGALADPACFATEQERYEAYIAATDWEVPDGYLQWVVQAATPAAGDQDKAWLRVDANGYPIEALLWVTAANAWMRWIDLPVFDGAAGGAANAYTMTPSPTLTAYQDGRVVIFRANHTNSGGATLNINGINAKAIVKPYNTALDAGDIENGQIVMCVYDGTLDKFAMVSPKAEGGSILPVLVLGQQEATWGTAGGAADIVVTLTLPAGREWTEVSIEVVYAAASDDTGAGSVVVDIQYLTGGVDTNFTTADVVTNTGETYVTANSDDSFEAYFFAKGNVPDSAKTADLRITAHPTIVKQDNGKAILAVRAWHTLES